VETTILDARELVTRYGPRLILDRVSLSLRAGERVGLVGQNGSGKSTLARLLCGLQEPDGGGVTRRRDLRLAYLEQAPSLDPALSAREAVLSGLADWVEARDRYEAASAALAAGAGEQRALLLDQEQAAAEVERLGGWERGHLAEAMLGHLRVDDPGALVGQLSGGMQRRVALARLLVARPDLALLDEPTNHLDLQAVDWLERYLLEEFRGALLLITHDRYLLNRVATRTLELDHGRLFSYEGQGGAFEAYLQGKAERLEREARAEASRQRLLRSELSWLRRAPRARTGKQKARVQRAQAALGQGPPPKERELRLELDAARTGKAILELRGLGLGTREPPLLRGLDFVLTRGQRVGIFGPNGCGKTTLLRTIAGLLEPAEGRVIPGRNTRPTYLSQAREELDPGATLWEAVAGDRGHVVLDGKPVEVRSYLGRFLFSARDLDRQVGSLSGGERTRVALARLLRLPTNLLLLDEPTNDLDLPTLAALEELLLAFNGTALVVTHDRWFLDRVATGLLVFVGGSRVEQHAGDYSSYRALRSQPRPEKQPARPAAPHKRAPKKRRPLTYAERLELEKLETEVEQADQRVARLEARLADPELYRGPPEEVARISAELDRAREQAAALLDRWEELELKKESSA
jgi:ATP-binding cassette subfamily F protein uup